MNVIVVYKNGNRQEFADVVHVEVVPEWGKLAVQRGLITHLLHLENIRSVRVLGA